MGLVTFSLFEGVAEKEAGLELAASSKNQLLERVRRHLRNLARDRDNRCVTADDATKFLVGIGEPDRALGNAAGSLFRSAEWEFTGCWTPSVRVSNHARVLRVWRLRDDS
jgi:hypothetical protein